MRWGWILAMAIAAGAAAPAAADDWITVDTADQSFHFAAPLQPTVTNKRGDEDGTPYDETLYLVKSNGFIEVGDLSVYPADSVVDLQLVVNGFVKSLGVQIISNEDSPFARGAGDVLPGRLVSVASDQVTCHLRAANDGPRVYALAACGQAGSDETANIDRAIASFAVTK